MEKRVSAGPEQPVRLSRDRVSYRSIMEPWVDKKVLRWCQLLLDSHRQWTGRELCDRNGGIEDQARALFDAPFVVVSHGMEGDPLLNYANRLALRLWEADWPRLIGTPSRLTAEPLAREERARMLARATATGFIDDYRGVRISAAGHRFLVERATVWNVVDAAGRQRGQAATFSSWTYLDHPPEGEVQPPLLP